MAEIHYETKRDCLIAIETLKNVGMTPPQWMLDQLAAFDAQETADQEQISKETPIWDTLKLYYPFGQMPQEKIDCVETAVSKLMETGEDAEKPGLLLGRIQCGKTDTFEDIIGLSFDKGINIAIVLTKGTKALVNQTIKRMEKDFRFFRQTSDIDNTPTIFIYDIMNVWRTLRQNKVESGFTIIVCKKNATNLNHLISMFENNEYLKEKKVLIVDDEADFASRNYRSVSPEKVVDENGELMPVERQSTLAKISQQIDDFRKIPHFCRYLQVTATPYCLYLQPDGGLNLNGKHVNPFKPRFTCLVPTHSKYVGGKQYFIDSQDENSMFWHLYHPITTKCINVLGHEDKRYLRDGQSSENIYGLTYALVAYFMGTAIRRIQKRNLENKDYSTSAVIHVEIDKKNHIWQKKVIDRLVNSISDAMLVNDQSDQRIWMAFDEIYEDFKESNRKAREQNLIDVTLPSKNTIVCELQNIFDPNIKNYHTQVVNSDEQMDSLLDSESGELELASAANIFIGGNILDRGVTVKNMICFFYGRNPKKFQQDTVLQHARMYGARSMEDMAVTRLHTTKEIYSVLKRMNALDDQLRAWFEEGRDSNEPNAVFVGFDKDIKPCAPSKIKVANTLVINPKGTWLPTGMWTYNKTIMSKRMSVIDDLITSTTGYSTERPFLMDKDRAQNILKLIAATFVYDDKYDNLAYKNDMSELMCVLDYCASTSDDKVYVMHRTNRNMSRIRQNGKFADAPADGQRDLPTARTAYEKGPVLMLLRQNGNKEIDSARGINIGWNNAPLYWPVLMTQPSLSSVMFSLVQKANPVEVINEFKLPDYIDPNDVITLDYSGDLVEHFGAEGTIYSESNPEYETRGLKESTASRYLQKDDSGKWLINSKVQFKPIKDKGLYSLNDDNFPFVFRPYKYMLLRNGRSLKADFMLLELFDVDQWKAVPDPVFDEHNNLIDADSSDETILISASDRIIDKHGNATNFVDKDITQWRLMYAIHKVLIYKPGKTIGENSDDEVL